MMDHYSTPVGAHRFNLRRWLMYYCDACGDLSWRKPGNSEAQYGPSLALPVQVSKDDTKFVDSCGRVDEHLSLGSTKKALGLFDSALSHCLNPSNVVSGNRCVKDLLEAHAEMIFVKPSSTVGICRVACIRRITSSGMILSRSLFRRRARAVSRGTSKKTHSCSYVFGRRLIFF